MRLIIDTRFDQTVSIYAHIPFCGRKCRYCSFFSVPFDESLAQRCVEGICEELKLYSIKEKVDTLYIGGGSPSVLPGELLGELTEQLANLAHPESEFTVEINPAQSSRELLADLRGVGVNRISIGAQSFIASELEMLGRIHSVENIYSTIESGRDAGFDNVSLDLIFALPGSSIDSWKHSLQKAIDLKVEHVSAYSLTWEEGTPLFKDLLDGKIVAVDEEMDRQMYETAIEILEAGGFEQYEISNFAKTGFRCRHNLRYWQNLPWIGLGPSAGSWYHDSRTTNTADMNRYFEKIEQGQFAFEESYTPGVQEAACETAVLNLRMREGIDRRQFEEQTGFNPMVLFEKVIDQNVKAGMVEVTDTHICLTQQALAIADGVECDFAAL